jgi:fucose 4-O-acetylase-like acetyltransferase
MARASRPGDSAAALRAPYPDALRGVGILFVVAIHAFAYLRLPNYGPWRVPELAVSLIAVPIFFFADGWLQASRQRTPLPPQAALASLQTSLRRLGVPWVVFSCLYLGVALLAERLRFAGGRVLLPHGISDLPLALWRGAAATQLYFLPALLLVRAVALVVQPRLCGRPIAAAFVAAAAIAVWKIGLEPRLPPVAAGSAEPLFGAGFGLAFAALGWAIAEAEIAGAPNLLWLIAAVLFGGVAMASTGRPAAMAVQCAYLLAAWWLARGFARSRLHRGAAALGRHTLEIYLLHLPIPISLISRALLLLKLPGPVALVADVAATTACSLAFAGLLRATLPASLVAGLGLVRGRPALPRTLAGSVGRVPTPESQIPRLWG